MESANGTATADVARMREALRNGGVLPASDPPPESKPTRRRQSPATTGRFKTLNDFVDHSAKLVDTTAQSVWMVLFREVRPTSVATVSFNQIADRLGVSRRTVIRAVQQLKDAKLVTVARRGNPELGSSVYRVHGTPVSGAACSVTHDTRGGVTSVT